VIPDTGLAFGQQEVFLGIDVDENLFAPRSNQLQNHFSNSFLGLRASVLCIYTPKPIFGSHFLSNNPGSHFSCDIGGRLERTGKTTPKT
jgi:hypothetical protein